jgi:hypothetical protein
VKSAASTTMSVTLSELTVTPLGALMKELAESTGKVLRARRTRTSRFTLVVARPGGLEKN